jgi:hypothetical protein
MVHFPENIRWVSNPEIGKFVVNGFLHEVPRKLMLRIESCGKSITNMPPLPLDDKENPLPVKDDPVKPI